MRRSNQYRVAAAMVCGVLEACASSAGSPSEGPQERDAASGARPEAPPATASRAVVSNGSGERFAHTPPLAAGAAFCEDAERLAPGVARTGQRTPDEGPRDAPCRADAGPARFYAFVLPPERRAVVTLAPEPADRVVGRILESCRATHCLTDDESPEPGAPVTLVVDSPSGEAVTKFVSVSGREPGRPARFAIHLRLEPLPEPATCVRRAPPYALVRLPRAGGAQAWAVDINDRGQVVGTVTTAEGDERAALWEHGALRHVDADPSSRLSAGIALNDAGQAIVRTIGVEGRERWFLWERGARTAVVVPPLGVALDINAAGEVAGSTVDASGAERAAVWRAGVATEVPLVPGVRSRATAINDGGQVVGWWMTAAGDRRAFLWDGAALTELGTLGGSQSIAMGVNAAMHVVGVAATAAGQEHPFLWQRGAMRDLNTLGGRSGTATDVNDAGQVVGNYVTASGGFSAFLFDGDTTRDLQALLVSGNDGFFRLDVNRMDRCGRIAGSVLYGGGRRDAVVLTPVGPAAE